MPVKYHAWTLLTHSSPNGNTACVPEHRTPLIAIIGTVVSLQITNIRVRAFYRFRPTWAHINARKTAFGGVCIVRQHTERSLVRVARQVGRTLSSRVGMGERNRSRQTRCVAPRNLLAVDAIRGRARTSRAAVNPVARRCRALTATAGTEPQVGGTRSVSRWNLLADKNIHRWNRCVHCCGIRPPPRTPPLPSARRFACLRTAVRACLGWRAVTGWATCCADTGRRPSQ